MITFIFGGGRNEDEVSALVEYYRLKIKRLEKAEIVTILSREKRAERIREEESRKIGSALNPDDYVLIFDERGEGSSSEAYAKIIETAKISHRRVVIVVGGAYGVTESLRERADKLIAFSTMIFPHQLARVMALEQTYRALSIIGKSKYHHS